MQFGFRFVGRLPVHSLQITNDTARPMLMLAGHVRAHAVGGPPTLAMPPPPVPAKRPGAPNAAGRSQSLQLRC